MTYNAPPFVFASTDATDNSTSFTGLSMDLLYRLAINVGFCYNVTYVPGLRAAGVVNNVEDTSMPLNLGIGSITITSARYGVCSVCCCCGLY